MVFFHKLLHLGIYVRRFFNAGWSFEKLLSGGSLGGLREVPGGQKIALGGLRGCPGGGQEAPKVASGGEKAPKSVQEGSWSDLGPKNGKAKEVGPLHLGGLGRPLGRLWAVLVALFWVILLSIIFYRFFIDF